MSKEGLKGEGKKRKQVEGPQRTDAKPLEERQEQLKKEVAKLLRQAGNDWRKLGEALYAIYKQDNEKALDLVGIISREAEWRWIKAPEFENEELGKWLDWLDRNGLNLPLNDEKTAKAVMALAALSGLKEIKGEVDVKKAFAITVLRKAARSDYRKSRVAAANLIGELGLQEEFKAELMLLMFDGYKDVGERARSAWRNANLVGVKAEYKQMKEDEKERVKGFIWDAARSDYGERRYAAAKLIGELGLQEEFKAELMLLMFDEWDVVDAAEDVWKKAGFEDVKAVYEKMKVKDRERLKELLRDVARSDDDPRRYGAPELIGKLGLQEEFRVELLLLTFDGDPYVRETAEDAWEKANLGDVKAEYEAMDEEEKERLKMLTREAARNGSSSRREAAANLIGELGLEKEFKAELLLLAFDIDEDVRQAAEWVWEYDIEDVKAVYEGMKVEEKERLKELLRDVARSEDGEKRYVVAKLIGELVLHEEFKAELMILKFDGDLGVRKAAEDTWENAGLDDVKAEYGGMKEEEKERVKGFIWDVVRWEDGERHYVAAKLIDELSLQKEFKAELMILKFDGDLGVRKAAEDTWENAGLDDVKAEYEAMEEEKKERVEELIKWAAMSDKWGKKVAAAKLIGELGLQEEFLYTLSELAYDEDPDVKGASRKALASLAEKKKQEVREGKFSLDNPFALAAKERRIEELAVAMVVLCL